MGHTTQLDSSVYNMGLELCQPNVTVNSSDAIVDVIVPKSILIYVPTGTSYFSPGGLANRGLDADIHSITKASLFTAAKEAVLNVVLITRICVLY